MIHFKSKITNNQIQPGMKLVDYITNLYKDPNNNDILQVKVNNDNDRTTIDIEDLEYAIDRLCKDKAIGVD